MANGLRLFSSLAKGWDVAVEYTRTLRSDVRRKKGRHKHPTAGSLDSQSVKTTAVASWRGFDAGKKINGCKRHILVDTLGLIITLTVTVASMQDRDGAKKLLKSFGTHRKKLRKVWVDGGYRGVLVEWVKRKFRYCDQLHGQNRTRERQERPLCLVSDVVSRRTGAIH